MKINTFRANKLVKILQGSIIKLLGKDLHKKMTIIIIAKMDR